MSNELGKMREQGLLEFNKKIKTKKGHENALELYIY